MKDSGPCEEIKCSENRVLHSEEGLGQALGLALFCVFLRPLTLSMYTAGLQFRQSIWYRPTEPREDKSTAIKWTSS